MRKFGVRNRIFYSFVGACLILAIPLSATEEFRAKLLNKAGLFSERMINIRIKIESYTTPDEIKELQKIIAEEGSLAFMNTFRKINKGAINFLSARGLNLRILAAVTNPTEKGREIMLVMERQSWDTETTIRIDSHYLYMVMVLNIDENGKGNGKLYKGAEFSLGGKKLLEITDSHPPMPLSGVRQRK